MTEAANTPTPYMVEQCRKLLQPLAGNDWPKVARQAFALMSAAAPKAEPVSDHDELAAKLRDAETWDLDADQAARDRCGVLMLEAAETLERMGQLQDPAVVHVSMLRGGIAKPTPAQIGHLYRGDEAAEVVAEVTRQQGCPRSVSDIAAERRRQVEVEGRSVDHDDGYTDGELAVAGACYGLLGSGKWAVDAVREIWPKSWGRSWLKSKPADPRRDLVKAGALIAAEIDRLDRLAQHKGQQS